MPDDQADPHALLSANRTEISAATKGSPDIRRPQFRARRRATARVKAELAVSTFKASTKPLRAAQSSRAQASTDVGLGTVSRQSDLTLEH
jgi:hypothetical protein